MKPSHIASSLRRIASKIEASKKPDRFKVARDIQFLARVAADQYQGKLTTYENMNDASGLSGIEGAALWAHLDGGEDNAVVIQKTTGPVAIWNVPDMSGYYWQALPLEDPNDAERVDGRDPGDLCNSIFT